jgi:hypothetical protein
MGIRMPISVLVSRELDMLDFARLLLDSFFRGNTEVE